MRLHKEPFLAPFCHLAEPHFSCPPLFTFVSRCPGKRFWPQTQPGQPDWYYNNCESVPSPNISFMGYTVRDQQFRYTGTRRTLHCRRTNFHALPSLMLNALPHSRMVSLGRLQLLCKVAPGALRPRALQVGVRTGCSSALLLRTQLMLTLLHFFSIGFFIRSHEDEDFYPLDFDATENENIVANATYATVYTEDAPGSAGETASSVPYREVMAKIAQCLR